MSIQSSIGSFTRNTQEGVRSVISRASGMLDGIVGSATTTVSNVFSGGFVGISTANADSLKNAINNYIQGVQDTINGFNENANLENAYKGEVQAANQEFLRAVKELLQAHITQMRVNLKDFDEVVANYTQSASDLGSQVTQQADEIRQNATQIKID